MSKSKEPVFDFNKYIIDGLIQCIEHEDGTPHLLCEAKAVSGPPAAAFKEGRIVLNVKLKAVDFRRFEGEYLKFTARFDSVSLPVMIHLSGVLAVYDRDTGQGRSISGTYSKTSGMEPMRKEPEATPVQVGELPVQATEIPPNSTVVNAADRFRNRSKE